MTQLRRAAIVSPLRTAVGKFGGALAPLTAGDLGAVILKALIERSGIDPARVDDVVFAQGYGNGEAPAIGHWSWLAAGLPLAVPGYQVDRRCGSGPAASNRCPMSNITRPKSAKVRAPAISCCTTG
jgi:acetyl-CoA C-acetyltransferase